ncbi:MAG TPA: hypothetical protein VK553_03800 [Candidatus Nitrosopolaris rasttigaisensis]|nr:hypothetical protein [Candidatus Nitrosopolaris rasttigaisensis]
MTNGRNILVRLLMITGVLLLLSIVAPLTTTIADTDNTTNKNVLKRHELLPEKVHASSSTAFVIDNNAIYHDTAFLSGGVLLLTTHTQPIVVHVGNFFRVQAMVLNNSTGTISFTAGPCDSTVSAIFNKNVVVKHEVSCFAGAALTSAAANLVKLRPGEKVSIIGTPIGTTYQAVASGLTIASVTFHYQLATGANASIIKSFEFNIMHS